MSHAPQNPLRDPRRRALALAFALAATLAGCGGGSDDAAPVVNAPAPAPAPAVATSVVTGTAASGAALANLVVTLKDSTNKAVTATTGVGGAFTLNSSDLSPPFLLQVTTTSGLRLLSVSTDGSRTATLNVTPLTDLVVRSWYSLQGRSAEASFDNPTSIAPPTPRQVQEIAGALLPVLQLAVNATGAPVVDPLDLIAKPFVADGTGIDKLLDNTRVTVDFSSTQLQLTAGAATQSTVLTFDTVGTSMTASSTTTNGTATTTASNTLVVPVDSTQLAAVDAINASLTGFAAAVNAKGSALVAADVEPFFDPDMVNDGLNRTQFLAGVVSDFAGEQVALSVDKLLALDAGAGTAQVRMKIVASSGGNSETQRETFNFHKVAGTWLLAGNGRIASISVQAEGRTNQGTFSGSNGPSVNIDVRPPHGTVSTISVTSTFAIPPVTTGATEVLPGGVQLDAFFSNTGPLGQPLPAAGTPVTVTLQKTAGGSVSYVLPLNAFTTELIHITSPTGTSMPTGTATVSWTLPSTYPVERIQLSAMGFTDDPGSNTGFQCINDASVVSPTATTGTVDVPSTCNGQPVHFVNINVSTNGPNGERSQVTYQLTASP